MSASLARPRSIPAMAYNNRKTDERALLKSVVRSLVLISKGAFDVM